MLEQITESITLLTVAVEAELHLSKPVGGGGVVAPPLKKQRPTLKVLNAHVSNCAGIKHVV